MPDCDYNNEEYLNDREYGTNNEIKLLPELNKYFNCECIKDNYRYATYDFHDEKNKIKIELKTRRLNYVKEHVSIIDYNKIGEY